MILRDYQIKAVEKCFQSHTNTVIACPTGSGKTAILGGICQHIINKDSEAKILVVSHIQEILKQDFEALTNFISGDILGLYSAGIGFRYVNQITVAGVQSCYNKGLFNDCSHIIIDEAHLIPLEGNGMYRTLLKDFSGRVIGLTATPFRLGKGYIYGEDRIFKNLCYDLTKLDNFNKLISDGWLSNIYSYDTTATLDTSGLKTIAGDFSIKDMTDKFNRSKITRKCIKELLKVSGDYKKILVFCIDIKHSEDVSSMMNQYNIKTKPVHSKMKNRDVIIEELRTGEIKAISNVDVLTTGFDDPEIDLIVMLRPTKSPVIHVQTIGRGLRIADGKKHCMVMDFAGNTKRLGPINDIVPYVAKKGVQGAPITKTCPMCRSICHPTVRVCPICGHKFQFKTDLSNKNTGGNIIAKGDADKIEEYKVMDIGYNIHKKSNRPDSIMVTYFTNHMGVTFREWICVSHKGYAKRVATKWLIERGVTLEVDTVEQFMRVKCDFRVAKSIIIMRNGAYPQISKVKF